MSAMESHIEQFLLRQSYCPLPDVGTLVLHEKGARILSGENRIVAPRMDIELDSRPTQPQPFIDFIAAREQVEVAEADARLRSYCQSIRELPHTAELKLAETGTFSVTPEGLLLFRQTDIPEEFHPTIRLKKVIHPNSAHAVRVGDKEHSSTFMTGYLGSAVSSPAQYWRRWAFMLALLALGVLGYFYYTRGFVFTSGNQMPVQPKTPSATYRTLP